MSGWIKLHRAFLDWEWYDDHATSRLFIHLLLKCNHKPNRWMGVAINTGQIPTGRLELAKQTGLSEQQVRTSLLRLESTSEITIKKFHKFSLITISKWEEYQDSNQQNNQQLTSHQPATNQPSTTLKEGKNSTNVEGQPSIEELLFGPALQYLVKNSGMKEQACRSLVGKWKKESGAEQTLKALREAQNNRAAQPVEYITRVLKPQQRYTEKKSNVRTIK